MWCCCFLVWNANCALQTKDRLFSSALIFAQTLFPCISVACLGCWTANGPFPSLSSCILLSLQAGMRHFSFWHCLHFCSFWSLFLFNSSNMLMISVVFTELYSNAWITTSPSSPSCWPQPLHQHLKERSTYNYVHPGLNVFSNMHFTFWSQGKLFMNGFKR